MNIFKYKRHFFTSLIVATLFGVAVLAQAKSANSLNAQPRIVTVNADGQSNTVVVNAKSIADAVKQSGVYLGEADNTEPSLKSDVKADNTIINVYRAHPITIVDGTNHYTVITAERSPREIAESAGFETKKEDQFAFIHPRDTFDALPITQLVIKRAKVITLDLYGQSIPITTHQTSVAQLLEDKSVELKPNDEMSVSAETRLVDGMTITVANVVRSQETVEEVAKAPVEQINDPNQDTGYKQVKEPGKDGKKKVTYETVIRNGGAPARNAVKEEIIEQPVKQVVIIGSKKPPVQGPAEIISKIHAASASKGIDGDRVARIAKCESGFNPLADSGYYKGLFQHDPGYWPARAAKYGFAGASIFDIDAQIGVSTAMMAGGGWSHWGCKG